MWFASKLFCLIVSILIFVLGAFLFFFSKDTVSALAHDTAKVTGIQKDLEYAMQAIGVSFMVIPGLFILAIADHLVKKDS